MVDFVFMKGLAAPRIAGLIGAQKYLQAKPQKRYDDTAIMIVEFVKHGYSSERGKAMIARMNQVHARFKIRQDDYLYVLTGLMFEPIRWNERFGWRPLTEAERLSHFHFWRGVGLQMNLTTIPASYAECERFNGEYERTEFRRTAASVELGDILFKLLQSWVPAPVRPLVKPGMATLIDARLREYFGVDTPPAWLQWLVPRVLRLRARVLRWLPRRRRSGFYVDAKLRSYPKGYAIADLGPPDDWKTPAIDETATSDARFCHHPEATTKVA
jgi:hypothetical protein